MNRFYYILVLCLILYSGGLYSQSTASYRFERMWPTLQQPWYFNFLTGIAVDSEGFIYVSSENERVVKLTDSGRFVTSWFVGKAVGTWLPRDIAIDKNDNIYLPISVNFPLVRIFNTDGEYLREFGLSGPSVHGGIVEHPEAIEVADNGDIYVLDAGDCSVEIFENNGTHKKSISGFCGTEAGQLLLPTELVVDPLGNIYVSSLRGGPVTKINNAGEIVDTFSFNASGLEITTNGQLLSTLDFGQTAIYDSNGILIEQLPLLIPSNIGYTLKRRIVQAKDGKIYTLTVAGIQQFASTGAFLSHWTSTGVEPGHFNTNLVFMAIATSSNGNIYVSDGGNRRIQRFDATGGFLGQWDLNFFPGPITVDGSDNVYVTGLRDSLIRKFSDSGILLLQFGEPGRGEGQIENIGGIAVDSQDNIYVTDRESLAAAETQRVLKYSPQGDFLLSWGERGEENGNFEYPSGIVIDSQDNVYVAELNGSRIQKFTASGEFLYKWGRVGSGDGELKHPVGLAIDNDDNIYVADVSNHRIQVFTSEGSYLTQFGTEGFGTGQFNNPNDVAVGINGQVFVADGQNNRVQYFKSAEVGDNSKAIVVSAGGPFAGNNLWDTTQLSANFAYRALTYQGFTKDSIYYLSSDLDLDLDQNGVADDVDADATNANLEYAITEWAADADNLIIYLVDHGGVDTFRMSGNEVMYSDELADWVNELQQTMPGRVTLVYDACESGTFMSALQPPSGVERTVITSTSPGENAVFISQGSISFSNYFWTHVFNGLSLEDAFSLSSEALTSTTDHQHPMLDYNGDGVSDTDDLALVSNVYIGNGTDLQASAPDVFGVSLPQVIAGTSTATITADGVEDEDGVSRVWVVVRPPDYQQGESGNPVQDLPSFDLSLQGDGVYTGSWDGFTTAGTYQLAIYASDRIGNTSVPLLTTVSVNSPLSKRAILVAAGEAGSPDYQIASQSTDVAYEALRQQGYDDDSIYYLSHIGTLGVDGSPSLSNLEFGITSLSGDDTQDLVVYLVGAGHKESITVTGNENLTPAQLDAWLDGLTAEIDGNVTVVIDTDNSGSFVQPLGNDKRIVVTGSGAEQPAHFFNGGDISYSHFYWRKVFNGSTVRNAHLFATRAMRFAAESQEAQLEDNGDGIANTKQDGELARHELHGSGILLAGDEPLIGSITQSQVVNPGQSLPIDVSGIATTGTIETVTAIVTSPAGEITTYTLNGDNTDYRLDGIAFTTPGIYDVAIYATDENRNTSLPITTEVEVQEAGFEVSLNSSQASYTAGQILSLNITIDVGAPSYAGLVDIYWSVTLSDGNGYYITDLNLTIATEPTPVVTDWSPGTLESTEILAFPLPAGLPAGDYTWKLTLTENGQLYSDPDSWLAQGRVVHGIE